jgi:hypothetical protein
LIDNDDNPDISVNDQDTNIYTLAATPQKNFVDSHDRYTYFPFWAAYAGKLCGIGRRDTQSHSGVPVPSYAVLLIKQSGFGVDSVQTRLWYSLVVQI